MDHTKIIPLFPLTIVQFPGALTALHIFEPRYRQMLDDVMTGDKVFGIVFRQAEGLAAVGCTVEVVLTKALPDGRSNILCVGISRFRLLEVIPDDETPYARAVIELLEDDLHYEDAEELAARVRSLFERLRAVGKHSGGGAAGGSELEGPEEPEEPVELDIPDNEELLSFTVAAHLEIDLGRKQHWLEMTNTILRLREIERELVDLLETEERKERIGRVSRTNGHGGKLPTSG